MPKSALFGEERSRTGNKCSDCKALAITIFFALLGGIPRLATSQLHQEPTRIHPFYFESFDFLILMSLAASMSLPSWDQSISVIIGASTGFGSHLARELASRGSRLFLIARQSAPLETLAQTLQRDFPRCRLETFTADATQLESLEKAAHAIASRCDSIHLLINAVGKSDRGRLLELGDEELQKLFELNVLTALHGVRAFHGLLKKSKGSIINIGSLSSKFAPRFLGGYSITKFGLAAATQQLRLELSEDGIDVMLACPGPIRRNDSQTRYSELASQRNLPESASAPGGGAKLKGLDPIWLSQQILDGAARGYPEMMFPAKSRLLLVLLALFPRWGESVLRKSTS